MLPLLIRVHNTATHVDETHVFRGSPVRIGRNELNDLVLREPFVSQWHAVIWFDEGSVRYVDLGSTNGTMVDGQRAQKNVPVDLRQDIDLRIGPLQLNFVRTAVAAEHAPASMRQTSFHISVPPAADGEMRTMMFRPPEPGDSEIPAASTKVIDSKSVIGIHRNVSNAAERLEPAYNAYRASFARLFEALQREIGQLPPDMKQPVLVALCERLQALGSERDVREMAKNLNVSPAAFGQVDAEAFLERLAPGVCAEDDANPALIMERVGAVLESLTQAYVELRKGYEQFGRDMAIQSAQEKTPLHRAQNGRDILRYLLQPKADGAERVTELNRAFAEIAIHQVAILSGFMDGVRSLLWRLSPGEVAGSGQGQSLANAPGTGILDLIIPFRVYGLWNRYVSRHRSYVEEDRFSREVFGRAFARAYYMVTGGQFEQGQPGPHQTMDHNTGAQPVGTQQYSTQR